MHTRLLLLFCLFSLAAHAILPDTVYIRTPDALGLDYRTLPVRTPDGYDLATWFFPAQRDEADDSTPCATIIICNGDAGNMSYFQLHLAEAWTAKGLNVVTFDWRGFGHSSPFTMHKDYLCYTEMLTDYAAVVDAVAALPEVKVGSIAVMGWSTGAYLSMITAHRHPQVTAFIGRSLATTFDDFIPLVMQVRNKTRDQLLIPNDFPVDEMPVHIASTFTKPIFLINGADDRRTPVWMSEKIVSLLPETTPRRLLIVPHAAHGGKEDPILLDFDNFIRQNTKFLRKAWRK